MAANLDVELFTGIGLSEQKAKETVKNKVISQALRTTIEEVVGISNFSIW